MSDPLPDPTDYCWPLDPGCLSARWDEYEEDVRDRATALAGATLYRLTLGRVGGCAVTVRPCPPPLVSPTSLPPSPFLYGSGWMMPSINASGAWVNCSCSFVPCTCQVGCAIHLPGYVGRLDEVKVGADVIDPDDYKLLVGDGEFVIAYQGSGDCPFPKTQDLSKPLGADGTFSVTYLPTRPVDRSGAWAAGLLASEFAKACTDDKNCKLPKNVTNVVRQGVSLTIIAGTFPNGLTGIREVDAYTALWNPRGDKGAVTQVWSPDMPNEVFVP